MQQHTDLVCLLILSFNELHIIRLDFCLLSVVTWQSCTTEGAYTKQQQLGCKMNAGKQRKASAPDSTTDKSNEYGYILRVQYSGQSTVPSQEHVRIYSPCGCRSLSKQLTGTIDPRDQPLHLCSIRYISKTSAFWCTCINQQVLYYWFKNKVFRSVRYRVNCFSLKQWGMRTDRSVQAPHEDLAVHRKLRMPRGGCCDFAWYK